MNIFIPLPPLLKVGKNNFCHTYYFYRNIRLFPEGDCATIKLISCWTALIIKIFSPNV